MEEEETKNNHPSLPPNYVSLAQLQEQWQKRKQKEKEEEKQKQIEREKIELKNQELAAKKQIGKFQKCQREGNYLRGRGNLEKSNLGRFEREKELKNQKIGGEKEIGEYQKCQREGNYVKNRGDLEKSKLGRFEREKEQKNQEIVEFQQHQREGNYVKNSRNVEKSKLGRFERQTEQKNQEIGQFQQHQRQGDYIKNRRNVEKSELGRFEREKEQKNQEIGGEKEIGQFQQHQREGNCVNNSRNVEKSKLGRFERETEQKNQEFDGEKEIGQFQQHQMEGDYVKNNRNAEKSKLGRFRGSDQSGCNQGRSYNENQENGGYKDKGKGKICEVGGSQIDSVLHRRADTGDFERSDGKFRRNCGEGVGSEVSMCGCVVAVEEDESVGIKKPDDGFRGGLRRNVGDLRVNFVVLENVGKRESVVETKKGLERGKKLDDETTRVGQRKKRGLVRPSRENKGDLLVNIGDNVGKMEGVEEKEEVLEGKENDRISDMGVATEIKNVEERNKNRIKKGQSRKKFTRGTEEGQGNGRGMAEENGIQLDLETNNGEKNGAEGSGDNIGDDDHVSEKVARPREYKHNRVSVGRRNVNGRVMEGTRGGYTIWAVNGDGTGANTIKNTVGEKSGNNESVEEIQVIESEINAKTDLRFDRSQKNDRDNIGNSEFQDNIIEKKENLKQELSGEQTDDKVMMMNNEANGERVRFRAGDRGNWDKKRFSRAYVRRDFKELSLTSQRVVGNGINNVQMYGSNRRFQNDLRFVEKQRNSGLVWVKKGDTADADVSET